jgi:hypothetical protein
MRCWVNTISRAHVRAGVEGGFTQAQHGRPSALKRLGQGDWIVFYSPRTEVQGGDVVQAFTAIGRVEDAVPYQVEMTPQFHPWRRRVAFVPAQEAPIRPLLDSLSFVKDRRQWGMVFRRGLFEIPEADFRVIARAMGATV